MNVDHDLAGTGDRVRRIAEMQVVGAAMFVEQNSLHNRSPE
jgi:hypothetical protein